MKKSRSILSILLLLFITLANLNAADTDVSKREYLKNFFAEDYIIEDIDECRATCRVINDDYKNEFSTKILDFDPTSGITTCEVFSLTAINNLTDKLSINANTLNTACLEEYNTIKVDYTNPNLVSNKYESSDTLDLNTITLTPYENSTITMSRFMGGLSTLDNELVKIAESRDGQIQKQSAELIYKLTVEGGLEKDNALLNSIDKLSQGNLSYYIDLFYNMDTIYDYIVSYIFVFISLFFMLIYVSRIAFKKLAKKTLSFEEPWQSKVAVIALASVIFFIPMKLDDNYSSTLFQNIWKYFVQESTSIADRANNIAMSTYIKKVYNTAGVGGIKTEANLVLKKEQQEFIKEYTKTLLDSCEKRFKNQISFQEVSGDKTTIIEESKSDLGDYILTLEGCRNIEKRYKIATTQYNQTQHNLNRIKASYEDTGNNIKTRLDNVKNHLDKRVQELGWYSAILAPTVQVLTKVSFLQGSEEAKMLKDNDPSTYTYNSPDERNRAIINEASQEQISKNGNPVNGGNWLANSLNTFSQGSSLNKEESKIAELFAKNAYQLLPGFSHIQKFFKDLGSVNLEALSNKSSQIKEGTTSDFASKEAKALELTASMIRYLIEFLPFITTFIAIGIVILMYIYELIIFSFISPFIVAFAVTTGQSRKILDFLVTALTIFLKPTLIIVAVYLSLFLFSIFKEILMLMAEEQFYLSSSSITDFLPSFIFSFVKELLFIFSSLAAVYLMWKLIMEMPSFIYKLVGLDKLDSGSQMATNMQQQFGRFGFRA